MYIKEKDLIWANVNLEMFVEEECFPDLEFALIAMKNMLVSSKMFLIITDQSNIRILAHSQL